MMSRGYINKFIHLFIVLFFSVSISVRAQELQVVTILSDNGYPPYSYVENGIPKGIYVDLINEVAKEMASDYKIKIRPLPWKRALQEIKNGREFAVMPPYVHAQREYIWPYSSPLAYERVVVFCHDKINFKEHISRQRQVITSPLNVGMNAGYLILNEQLSRAKRDNKIRIWENHSTVANIQKLLDKRIDCYLNDPLSTQWVLNNLPKKNSLISLEGVKQSMEVMVQTAHIGYSNVNPQKFHFKDDFVKKFNKALEVVKRNKAIERIVNKYVGDIK